MASFNLTIDTWVNDVTKSMENIFKEIVIDLGESLVTMTPVLTGRLRGNWIMTINSPATNSLIRYDTDGGTTIADIIDGAMSLSLGDVAYIVNNLTYSELIEDGGSQFKAPEGMLIATADKFEFLLIDIIERNKV
jgi:hypothetical protein